MSSFSSKSSHPSPKAGPQKDIPQHEYERLVLTTCIFQFSLLLSFFFPSPWRSWHLPANVCHYSVHSSAWNDSALGHTHTHKQTEHRQLPQCVSSLLAGGSRVDAAWKISTVIAAKPQPRKTSLSASLYMCLSWFSLARRVALRGRHQGSTWPLTSISSRSPLHSNLARSWWWAGILLRVAATCFHHLLFTFPPSIFLFSCYRLL